MYKLQINILIYQHRKDGNHFMLYAFIENSISVDHIDLYLLIYKNKCIFN